MAGASTRPASRDEFEGVVQHVLAGMPQLSGSALARLRRSPPPSAGSEVCRDQAVQRGYDPRATGMLAGRRPLRAGPGGQSRPGPGPGATDRSRSHHGRGG